MNNAVDYLEFENQARVRGHITIAFEPTVTIITVMLLSFTFQELADVNFVTAASAWENGCASARQSSWHERKEVMMHKVSSCPLELMHPPHCLQLLVQYDQRNSNCNLLCPLIKTYCTKPLGIMQGSILAFFPLLKNSVYNFLSVEKVLCYSSKPVHRSSFSWSYTLFLHFSLLWPVLVRLLIQQLFSTSLVAGELTGHLVSKWRVQTVWNGANEKDTF